MLPLGVIRSTIFMLRTLQCDAACESGSTVQVVAADHRRSVTCDPPCHTETSAEWTLNYHA
eukprot:2469-Heterococcus_DN1.PRE.1